MCVFISFPAFLSHRHLFNFTLPSIAVWFVDESLRNSESASFSVWAMCRICSRGCVRFLEKDHSDSVTVHSLLWLSVFVARFWLPVVNLGSHSSLVCNRKQSEPLRVFSNGILLRTQSLKTARFCLTFPDRPTLTAILSAVASKVHSFSSIAPFHFFFCKLLIASIPILLNPETLQRRARFGKDQRWTGR